MRINKIEIENFMRLKAIQFVPKPGLNHIVGDNGAGKTAFLNAIVCALSGRKSLPVVPVRDGQEMARITLDLGEIIVKWRCKPNRETTVIVESADGARYPSPIKMLERLFGERSIDPLEFWRATPAKRLEMLRAMVKIDLDVDAIEQLNERDYNERKAFNSRANTFAERVKNVEANVNWTMDVVEQDMSALVDALANAMEHNSAIGVASSTRAHRIGEMKKRETEIEELDQQIARLMAKRDERSSELANLREAHLNAAPLPDPVDVTDLRAQMGVAETENARKRNQIHHREQLASAKKELEECQAASARLTAQIEERTKAKNDALAAVKFPVDGLSLGTEDVLFNGLPFSQASSGDAVPISTKIAMQANPELRLLLIRDASLVGRKNMALVAQSAEEEGYQVFMESVRTGSTVGLELEAGEVVAIDGVPVRAEETEAEHAETSVAVGA
jgi:predicted ATP-dependent endonuclease of OLD family